MTAIDDLVQANSAYARIYHGGLAGKPAKQLAVVTCMDTRIDPFAALGMDVGEAHIMRNAGGLVTDDMLRSLVISQRALGTREIAVIHHTRCGMDGFDDDGFRGELAAETGQAPTWDVPGFSDVRDQVRESLAAVRACAWLPHRDQVRGFVLDVDLGRIDEVD